MEVYNKLTNKKFYTNKEDLKTSLVVFKADCSAYVQVGSRIFCDVSELDSVHLDSNIAGEVCVYSNADGSKYRVARVSRNGVNAVLRLSEQLFAE
jgi:hypothetical protein